MVTINRPLTVELVEETWGQRHPWLHLFSAVTASILVAGILLGLGLRWYLHWSVAATADKLIQQGNNRR